MSFQPKIYLSGVSSFAAEWSVDKFYHLSRVQVCLHRVAVCLSESCWRITLSSMCPMWLMSWAASTSSPPRWCPVSLWTRPPTFLRSSGMRYERHGLDTSPSHSTIYTRALAKKAPALEAECRFKTCGITSTHHWAHCQLLITQGCRLSDTDISFLFSC